MTDPKEDLRVEHILGKQESYVAISRVRDCQCQHCLCRFPAKPGVVWNGLQICWRCKTHNRAT